MAGREPYFLFVFPASQWFSPNSEMSRVQWLSATIVCSEIAKKKKSRIFLVSIETSASPTDLEEA